MVDATILIVDDESSLRQVLARYLVRLGYHNVRTAEDGAQALEMLRHKPVDLLLTDVRMPKVDGVELLKQLRDEDIYLPGVLLMSGFSDISRREMHALGVQALMDKPLGLDDLRDQVAAALLPREHMWSLPLNRIVRQNLQSTEACLRVDGGPCCRNGSLPGVHFGRGGFTIQQEAILTPGPVSFTVDLVCQQQTLSGTGVVRWYSRKEQLAGIELSYLEEPGRSWFLEQQLCDVRNGFIPALCMQPEPAAEPLVLA